MQNERLIELVKQFSFLYDVADKRYTDVEKKEAAWKEIGKHLNESAKKCKRQWNYLRDSYRRALKRRRDPDNGKAGVKMRKWKFEDEMAFLTPFIKERTCMQTSDESDHEVDFEAANLKQEISRERQLTPTIYDVSSTGEQSTDEIDLFFTSIAATVKKFSPYMQAIAKARVFNVISELELQAICNVKSDNPSSTYASFSPKSNLTGT